MRCPSHGDFIVGSIKVEHVECSVLVLARTGTGRRRKIKRAPTISCSPSDSSSSGRTLNALACPRLALAD
eukprot:1888200-Amphidinium_carterae.1